MTHRAARVEAAQAMVEDALASVMASGLYGPQLVTDARLAVHQALRAAGMSGARIDVRLERGVLHVDWDPPPEPPTVRALHLRMGGGPTRHRR
jgi:hypothetical protein